MNRHRWWAIGTFLVVAAGAMMFYRANPPRYTASADVALECTIDGAGVEQAGRRAREMALLGSPKIADRVVGGLSGDDRRAIAHDADDPGADAAAAALVADLSVRPRGTSYAATVSYSDADPARAARVTNLVVGRYVAHRRDGGVSASRVVQARGRADIARRDMTRTAAAATDYRASAGTIDADDLPRLERDAAALDVQLAGIRAREAAPVGDAIDPAADPSLKTLRDQLARLTASRATLQERYGPLHPDMIAMNARVASLTDRIAVETARVRRVTDAARAAHQRVDERMAAAITRAERQTFLDDAAAAAASRDAQAASDLKLAEARQRGCGHARILAPARVSATSPSPDRTMIVAIGLLAALVAAAAVVAVRELGTTGLRSRRAAERRLRLPVIGMVPEVAYASGTALNDLVLSGAAPDFTAAFGSMNASLGLAIRTDGPRVIAVTSAFQSEGKTTVSIGIARLAARAGLRVLLIDCDVRRPAATQALAPDAEACLADVLAGKVELAQARVRDEPSGAWVLASGLSAPAGLVANGLVGSDAMQQLIERAVRDHDLILLDMAPVLALAETRVAAAFVQRVVLVARWRSTPVKAVRIALNLLNEAGCRVAALVLTRVAA